MSKYLRFNSVIGFGYQIISRNAVNQTFVFWHYRNITSIESDVNYQLVVL